MRQFTLPHRKQVCRQRRRLAALATVFVLGLLTPTTAFAHPQLAPPLANLDTLYQGELRVPHGCDDYATVKLRIRLPTSLKEATATSIDGWTSTVSRNKKGETEITWSGARLAPDVEGRFKFQAKIGDVKPGTKLYIPVLQFCEQEAQSFWIDVPESDQNDDDLDYPAPSLTIERDKVTEQRPVRAAPETHGDHSNIK